MGGAGRKEQNWQVKITTSLLIKFTKNSGINEIRHSPHFNSVFYLVFSRTVRYEGHIIHTYRFCHGTEP
jgi:hypothetical protein